MGVIAMGGAIALLFALPWLDRSPARSMRYRSRISKIMLFLFVVSFLALGYLGLKPVTDLYTLLSRIFTGFYFLFLVTMPWWSRMGSHKNEPERVTNASH